MTPSENQDAQSTLTPRQEYKKNWDKKKHEASKAAGESETAIEQKNMNFFIKIVKSLKLSYKQLSELTGVSQQLISWWLMADDCKLSNIISIFEKIGMKIECSYSPLPGSKYVFSTEKFTIEIGELPVIETKSDNDKNLVIDEAIRKNGKLKFLAEFIDGLEIGLVPFCKNIEFQYFTVYQWFKKDDIKISKIYEIANRTQQKVNWKLTSLKKTEESK